MIKRLVSIIFISLLAFQPVNLEGRVHRKKEQAKPAITEVKEAPAQAPTPKKFWTTTKSFALGCGVAAIVITAIVWHQYGPHASEVLQSLTSLTKGKQPDQKPNNQIPASDAKDDKPALTQEQLQLIKKQKQDACTDQLKAAINFDVFEDAKKAIKGGAEINIDDMRHGLLQIAIEKNNPKIVLLLIEHGAQIDREDASRETAFQVLEKVKDKIQRDENKGKDPDDIFQRKKNSAEIENTLNEYSSYQQ